MGFLAPTVRTSVSVGQTSEFVATNSQYGLDIPKVFGTDRLIGNIIWWSDIRLIKSTDTQTQGGKGGPKQQTTTTTYEYFVDLDVAFSEGEAQNVLRIWADGKIIYDATGASIDQIDNLTFRFYSGTETQLPDPLVEAAEGANNVSAHRGLVHIVFENLDLSDFGNRIPAISAEFTFGGQDAAVFETIINNDLQDGAPQARNTVDNYVVFGKDGRDYYWVDRGIGQADFIMQADFGASSISNVARVFGSGDDVTGLRDVDSNGRIFHDNNEGNSSFPGLRFQIDNGGTFRIDTSIFSGQFKLFPQSDTIALYTGASNAGGGTNKLVLADTSLWTGDPWPAGAAAEIDTVSVATFQDRGMVIRGNAVANDVWNVAIDGADRIAIYKASTTNISLAATLLPSNIDATETSFSGSDSIWAAYNEGNGDLIIGVDGDTNGPYIFAWNETDGVKWSTVVPFRPTRDAKVEQGARLSSGVVLAHADSDGALWRMFLSDGSLDPNYDGQTAGILTPGFSSVNFWDETTSTLWTSGGIDSGNVLNTYANTITSGQGEDITPPLIIGELCEDAGLSSSEYDVSALPISAEDVKSLRRDSRQSFADIIQNLLDLMAYTVVEVDGALTFRQKGLASSITIPEADLVVSGDRQGEVFARSVLREKDLPRVFEVNYRDSDNAYQDNVQREQRPASPVSAVVSDNVESFDYSGSGRADAFQAAAVRDLYAAWAEINRLQYRLPQKYLGVTATDTITLDIGTTLFEGRVRSSDLGANFTTDIEKVIEVDGQYTVIGVGDGGSSFQRDIPNTGPTDAYILNLPLLFDVDSAGQDVSVLYWGGAGEPTWPGCLLYQLEGTSIANNIGTSTAEIGVGTTATVIPDPTTTTRFEDDAISFDITVEFGVDQFESTTEANVLAGANTLAVVKANGETELIQFKNAVLVSGTTIRVSGLLRGRRGTEPYATGHALTERVILLSTSSIQLISNARTAVGSPIEYVAPTLGQLFESAIPFDFTPTAEDLKPYSPVHVALTNPGTPDGVDISWVRRTRIGGELTDGFDVPLSEQSENYEVDILDGPGGSVLRTLMSTTESVNYSDANITSDFGSLPATLDVVVYQISDAVGRGKPAIVSLETA